MFRNDRNRNDINDPYNPYNRYNQNPNRNPNQPIKPQRKYNPNQYNQYNNPYNNQYNNQYNQYDNYNNLYNNQYNNPYNSPYNNPRGLRGLLSFRGGGSWKLILIGIILFWILMSKTPKAGIFLIIVGVVFFILKKNKEDNIKYGYHPDDAGLMGTIKRWQEKQMQEEEEYYNQLDTSMNNNVQPQQSQYSQPVRPIDNIPTFTKENPQHIDQDIQRQIEMAENRWQDTVHELQPSSSRTKLENQIYSIRTKLADTIRPEPELNSMKKIKINDISVNKVIGKDIVFNIGQDGRVELLTDSQASSDLTPTYIELTVNGKPYNFKITGSERLYIDNRNKNNVTFSIASDMLSWNNASSDIFNDSPKNTPIDTLNNVSPDMLNSKLKKQEPMPQPMNDYDVARQILKTLEGETPSNEYNNQDSAIDENPRSILVNPQRQGFEYEQPNPGEQPGEYIW